MWFRGLPLGFVAFAVIFLVSCQGAGTQSPPPPSSAQVLYVLENDSVTTYSIDPASLAPSMVGDAVVLLPASASWLQITPSPNGQFLYALWTDVQQQEHLSTFSTDASGVPQIPAIQDLSVNSLSQLNIYPNGKFAYAMQLNNSTAGYVSAVRLFRIGGLGKLQLASGVLATYGPSPYPTLLYGVSSNGDQLYLTAQTAAGPQYWERGIDPPSGTLDPSVLFYSPPGRDSVVFGAKWVIDYQNRMNYSRPQYLDILSNQPDPRQLIRCTSAMLPSCASATNAQFDPSGKYLFLTDPASQRIQIARIDMSAGKIVNTGKSLPFTARTPGFAFSPDGTLVYALLASDFNVHVFQFDSSNGTLTEGLTPIPVGNSGGFLPALRQ